MNVKILIVDDEILQLHLIGKVMARFRPEYEITMTHQPQEALELLRTGCFNALMTDVKMPEMSGIDLIRQVRQLGMEELEIIILSGFDDFQYARSAISFNVLEYLLKPIDAVSLEDALCKLEAKLLQNVEKRRLQNSYTQKQQALALYKKACGMQLSEKEQKAVKEFGDRVRLILSESCTDLEAFQASLPPEACVEQLGQERALAFVPVPWGALAEVPEFPGQSAVAVGLPCSPDALPQRLRELRECAQTARWLGRKRVVQSPTDEGLLQACVQAIRSQDGQKVEMLSGRLHLAMCGGSLTMEQVFRVTVEELGTQAYEERLARVYDCRKEDRLKVLEEKIRQCTTPEKLCAAVAGMLAQTTEESDAFEQSARVYIEAHYMEDCSLNDIAQEFHYSTSHFSRRFSAAFGTTYTRYLAEFRLEKAREFLLNTDWSVREIALRVGIGDSGYLIRQFSKKYALSPEKYRRHGR